MSDNQAKSEDIQPYRARAERAEPAVRGARDEEISDEGLAEGVQALDPNLLRKRDAVPRLTTFIGKEVIEPRPGIVTVIVWLSAALLGLIAGLVLQNPLVAFVVVPFPLLFGLLLCWRPRIKRIHFAEDEILVNNVTALKYADIMDVYRDPKNKYEVIVIHSAGHLAIPSPKGAQADLDEFLRSQRRSPSESPQVAPVLRNFLKQQLLMNEPGNVHHFRARVTSRLPRALGFWFRFTLAACLTGLIWAIFAVRVTGDRFTALTGLGAALATIAGIFLLICVVAFVIRHKPAHKFSRSEMIISPSGLALVQGDLQGELSWREVVAVKPNVYGIFLKVQGADILIMDVYQWPIAYAKEQILRYWNDARR